LSELRPDLFFFKLFPLLYELERLGASVADSLLLEGKHGFSGSRSGTEDVTLSSSIRDERPVLSLMLLSRSPVRSFEFDPPLFIPSLIMFMPVAVEVWPFPFLPGLLFWCVASNPLLARKLCILKAISASWFCRDIWL